MPRFKLTNTDVTILDVKEIDPNTGVVTFDDGTDSGVSGTKLDCDAFGYDFVNNQCIAPGYEATKRHTPTQVIVGGGNFAKGNNINIQGSKNTVNANNVRVVGTGHEVSEDYTHIIGNSGSAIRYGEFVHAETPYEQTVAVGNPGRAQRSVLIYQGRTTDNTETEIFLGGIDGKRFIVDENKECVICFESRVVAKRVDSSSTAAMGKFQHGTFRVTGGALDRLGLSNKTNHNDGISGWTNDFVAVNDADLGDHIKATVTGQSSCTIDWTIIVYVNEIRTSLR